MTEETTFKIVVGAEKHFDGHQYTNAIGIKDDKDDEKKSDENPQEFMIQIQKAERAIRSGAKIICSGVEFGKNTETITRQNVRGDCGVKFKIDSEKCKYQVINNQDDDNTDIEKIFANQPKPVIPSTAIDSKKFMGVFLVEQATLSPTTVSNKVLSGEITNGKDFKFPCWIPNFPVTQRNPLDTELLLCKGVFRIIHNNGGFQVQGWGKIIYADKHTVYPDAYIERKRLEFLKGNTLECISKDLVQCTSVEEMVRKVHGSKVKKHSPPMRMYVKGLEWNRIVKEPKNGDEEPWYNGTLYGCSNPELSGVRLKVKDKVMREVIMLKPASQARNYKSDLALMMDVTDRIEDKFWNVELMYAFVANKAEESNKKVGQPPAKKKRKKNNSAAPQCVTGYISVISMKPC
eukprot:469952_1